MKNKLVIYASSLLLFVFTLLTTGSAFAQCAMCKASVETSVAGGSRVAVGINYGILYLLLLPYILFSVIFFMWYRSYRKNKRLTSN